jgi:hypothetical protein
MFELLDILITALLRQGVKHGSFLTPRPAVTFVETTYKGTPDILHPIQPGYSIIIITDHNLSFAWAHELAARYDIIIVYYNREHFVTWLRRVPIHVNVSISTRRIESNDITKWRSAIKKIRYRRQRHSSGNPFLS